MSTHGQLPVKTDNNGDVVVKLVDSAGTNLSAIDAHGSQQVKIVDSTGANSISVDAHGSAPIVIHDASGVALGTATNPLQTEIAATAPGGAVANPGFSQLTAGSAKVGQVAIDQTTDGVTNAVHLLTGANKIGNVGLDQTSTNNGVQVVAGPGTSSGNPLFVNTGTGASGVPKNSGQLKSTALAAAGTATLSAIAITTAKAGNLSNLLVSSSGAARYDLQTVSPTNVVTTLFSIYTTAASPNAVFKPNTLGEITIAGADGTNAKYQVLITNIDTNALDFYAYIAWQEL
jgi:hypothetical protein